MQMESWNLQGRNPLLQICIVLQFSETRRAVRETAECFLALGNQLQQDECLIRAQQLSTSSCGVPRWATLNFMPSATELDFGRFPSLRYILSQLGLSWASFWVFSRKLADWRAPGTDGHILRGPLHQRRSSEVARCPGMSHNLSGVFLEAMLEKIPWPTRHRMTVGSLEVLTVWKPSLWSMAWQVFFGQICCSAETDEWRCPHPMWCSYFTVSVSSTVSSVFRVSLVSITPVWLW